MGKSKTKLFFATSISAALFALLLTYPTQFALADTTSEIISQFCDPPLSQLCNPPIVRTFETSSQLDMEFTMASSHCSSVRIHVSVDGNPVYTSPFLGAGGSTGVISFGPVSPGMHTLEIQAEGTIGGCNFGQLSSWGGTLDVETSDLPSNTDPDCSDAVASKDSIWPPNHKMVDISVLGVTDSDGDAVSITVVGIEQDEAVSGKGSGKTSPDGVIDGDSAQVRAERSGKGDGRVYEISFTADDGNGGMCSGSVLTGVPHDKKDTAVDSGVRYDSTS